MQFRYIKSPCKNCTDRKFLCHSNCTKYKDYQVKQKNENDRVNYEDGLVCHIEHSHYDSWMNRGKSPSPEPLKHNRKERKK